MMHDPPVNKIKNSSAFLSDLQLGHGAPVNPPVTYFLRIILVIEDIVPLKGSLRSGKKVIHIFPSAID